MSYKIVGIGEALWDLLPTGPELGGAPANFAYHAYALGARARVITRVGKDHYGDEIVRRFEDMGLPSVTVQKDDTAPTGTVSVTLSGNGIPEFTIRENVAWDHITATHSALTVVREADAICFGSLAQRNEVSRHAIQLLVAAAPAPAWRIFDINLRQRFYSREVIEQSLKLANVLKLNADELPILAKLFEMEGSAREVVEKLARRHALQVVAVTRGPDGSLLYQGGRWSDHVAQKVVVKDTVGAGDSFTAALCLGLLGRMDLDEINAAANQVAAFVCSCAGATPQLPDALRRLFNHSQRATSAPVVSATAS